MNLEFTYYCGWMDLSIGRTWCLIAVAPWPDGRLLAGATPISEELRDSSVGWDFIKEIASLAHEAALEAAQAA